MTVEQKNDDPRDQFPIGMRVLAVDDDPTCLKLLETLLRRCQYHVTTTNQARTALQMLRENKNRFDLVISDVHMPDMDGFKLLELVGLDMDLPVIMLSANGDTKLVMKGISHGACDYLLKPVRIEELKNIWQHVIRRKKIEPKSQKASGHQEKNNGGSGEGETGSAGTGNSDQYGKPGKRRKDQNEDEDDDRDEDDEENDDPSTQKKPRVVWSVELHRKFVAAVNQLGIDKAVPKKILDLMNVEKLTRENVASHLQKYRLYLKRINCVANQQANMVAAFGTTDPSYLRMGPINGHGHYNPVQFPNQPFRSYPPGGMVGRLNTPSGLGMTCLPSSGGMIQLGNSNDHMKFHENGVLQGMPMPFELDRHHGEGSSHIGDLSTSIDEISGFPISSGINDPKIPANLLMQGGRDYGNPSLKSEFCSSMANLHRGNESWSGSSQSKSFLLSDRFKQTALHSSGSRMAGNQFDATPMADSQCQVSGISNSSLIQAWDAHRQNAMSSSMNPLNIPINNGSVGGLDQRLEVKNPIYHRNMEFNHMGQPNYADSLMTKYDEVEKSTMTYQQRTLGDFIPSNSFGPLGDVVSAMMKQEHDKHEGDFGGYTLGNGI